MVLDSFCSFEMSLPVFSLLSVRFLDATARLFVWAKINWYIKLINITLLSSSICFACSAMISF